MIKMLNIMISFQFPRKNKYIYIMTTNKNNKNISKTSSLKTEVKISLSSVANKLRGKELFPEKIEIGKQFFKDLETKAV